jgi:type II secretory pathway pseudopilin PulG
LDILCRLCSIYIGRALVHGWHKSAKAVGVWGDVQCVRCSDSEIIKRNVKGVEGAEIVEDEKKGFGFETVEEGVGVEEKRQSGIGDVDGGEVDMKIGEDSSSSLEELEARIGGLVLKVAKTLHFPQQQQQQKQQQQQQQQQQQHQQKQHQHTQDPILDFKDSINLSESKRDTSSNRNDNTFSSNPYIKQGRIYFPAIRDFETGRHLVQCFLCSSQRGYGSLIIEYLDVPGTTFSATHAASTNPSGGGGGLGVGGSVIHKMGGMGPGGGAGKEVQEKLSLNGRWREIGIEMVCISCHEKYRKYKQKKKKKKKKPPNFISLFLFFFDPCALPTNPFFDVYFTPPFFFLFANINLIPALHPGYTRLVIFKRLLMR